MSDTVSVNRETLSLVLDEIDGQEMSQAGWSANAELRAALEQPRDHITDGSPCWCNPETVYTDPETGASVIVHKEPQ